MSLFWSHLTGYPVKLKWCNKYCLSGLKYPMNVVKAIKMKTFWNQRKICWSLKAKDSPKKPSNEAYFVDRKNSGAGGTSKKTSARLGMKPTQTHRDQDHATLAGRQVLCPVSSGLRQRILTRHLRKLFSMHSHRHGRNGRGARNHFSACDVCCVRLL